MLIWMVPAEVCLPVSMYTSKKNSSSSFDVQWYNKWTLVVPPMNQLNNTQAFINIAIHFGGLIYILASKDDQLWTKIELNERSKEMWCGTGVKPLTSWSQSPNSASGQQELPMHVSDNDQIEASVRTVVLSKCTVHTELRAFFRPLANLSGLDNGTTELSFTGPFET